MIEIRTGDCLDVLRDIPGDSIDSLVTDPPAGISFMGKSWDGDRGGRDEWIKWLSSVMKECIRVMKPGAHGLVWAIPRTSHWTATALEDAGFEIRDVVTHLFGSGFPKSLDVSKAIDKAAGAERAFTGELMPGHSEGRNRTFGKNGHIYGDVKEPRDYISLPATDAGKQWQGWCTALKPASEHWILIRKPISEKTVAANVLKWGTGAINIDASRVGTGGHHGGKTAAGKSNTYFNQKDYVKEPNKIYTQGRFPANLILSCSPTCTEDAHDMFECPIALMDEQSGVLHSRGNVNPTTRGGGMYGHGEFKGVGFSDHAKNQGASRFFYCAKASKADKGKDNVHPTVKATKLMSYLIRMITPPNGIVLDPFMGSGSTGVAAKKEGFGFVGIEREPEYVAISEKRLTTA